MAVSNHARARPDQRDETICRAGFDDRLNRSMKAFDVLPCKLTPVKVRKRLKSPFKGFYGHCEIRLAFHLTLWLGDEAES